MNGAFYISSVGLQSQQRALDVIAGNIANVNTPAFKRSQVRFSEVLAMRSDPDVPRADLDNTALATSGVRADSVAMMNEPGTMQVTGSSMDVAIEGQGFIELMGPNGQTLLWRGGTMKVGEDGLLSAVNGMALKAAITIPDDTSAITIAADGVVRARTGEASPVEVGQIALVKVSDPAMLQQLDGGLYRANDGARLVDAQAGEDGTGMLVQGSIERSNVEMTTEMVQLMLVQRAYAANAQLIQAADQLMSIANSLRR
ncbi:flagellar hook basal-body protein [Sphingomonas sp. QA11]|uniref:flagellar hook-basal body protein n=1 Tax=Sphingomonas sp. QA11 TaxID=2950605 RepID=UPI0023493DBA|nr:flagellar hook basal-body protein [Sphingomonas sp. QA11]WCM27293.1 flagellar hook basal-body protein [Sphingomonas sp. QA11]